MRVRAKHYALTIGFLAIIVAVGPFQAASELRQGEAPQVLDLFRNVPAVAALRTFENDLEKQSLVAKAVRQPTQYLRYRVFGDSGDKALVGDKDWWFYRQDARYLTERCPDDPIAKTGPEAVVSAIVKFEDQLAQMGIKLLVIPIPGKPSVYPDMITSNAVPCDPRGRIHTSKVMSGLAVKGTETVNLLQAFARVRTFPQPAQAGEWYLARDTHWSNSGARLAAKVVANRIRSLGWAQVDSVQYDVQPVLVWRPGDVLKMLRCPSIEAMFDPEEVQCERVVRKDDGKPYRDDPASPILVLGDSYLRIYERDEPGSAGFVAHLARELGQALTSIVSDGGASTLVRQELARKPGLLKGKKLVVWEFVERDIRFGMEGWRDVALTKASPLVSAKR